MGAHPSAALTWSLWTLSTLLIVSSILLDLLTPGFLTPIAQKSEPVLVISSGLLALALPTAGALVASHLHRNPIGWIFFGMGLLYGVRRFATAYADYALLVRPSLPAGEYAAWTSTWLRFSGLIALGALLVLLFPGGSLPSRRWRIVAWATVAGAAMLAIGDAFRFGPLPTYYHAYNPLGVAGTGGRVLDTWQLFETSSVIGGMLLSAGCVASLVALVLRLRRAREGERWQLRWFSYVAVPALVGSVVTLMDWTAERFTLLLLGKTFLPLLWMAENSGLFGAGPRTADRLADLRLDTILEALTTLAFSAIPICAGIAIVKHRLYTPDLATNRRVSRSVAAVSALGWSRVLLTGMAVGVLSFALYLAIYYYVVYDPTFVQDELGSGHLADTVAIMGGWVARLFFLAAAIPAAWWVAQRAKGRVALHGSLMGLVAAIVNQTTIYYSYSSTTSYFYKPVTLTDVSIYVALGVAGGWLGGIIGNTTLAGDVYAGTRRIGRADDPEDVAAAIGEHLGGSEAHGVTLWRATPRSDGTRHTPQEYERWSSWTPYAEEVWPHGANLAKQPGVPNLARFEGEPSMVVRSTSLSATERAAWERQGIGSILFMPLIAPGEVQVGLLTATFRKSRGPSRRVTRAYMTVGAQAALALENMRLVEEARRTGRTTGLLDERQRLAHEIHDTLAQGFTGIITSLTAAQMSKTGPAADASSPRYLEDAERMAREGLAEARRLVWALRPESLDRGSLPEALHRLARDWSGETHIEAQAATTGEPRPLLPETEVALLRTAQEALTNTRKHAGATTVNITLSYMNDCVTLDVVDDGAGFDPDRLNDPEVAHDAGGFGLVAMRERIEQLGGTLVVESAPGQGTAVAVELPVSPDLQTPGTGR